VTKVAAFLGGLAAPASLDSLLLTFSSGLNLSFATQTPPDSKSCGGPWAEQRIVSDRSLAFCTATTLLTVYLSPLQGIVA
jgi:hypothetical protein